jgi:hypothetical protein
MCLGSTNFWASTYASSLNNWANMGKKHVAELLYYLRLGPSIDLMLKMGHALVKVS